ncbi:cation-translocating P-type ATPase [bacterium]|nr:cation-translocating P-type ATPase [bacterium]
MLDETKERLSSLPALTTSGIMLAASFVLSHFDISLPIDPVWATLAISGTPLLLETAERLAYSQGINKISSPLLITMAMFASVAIGDLFAAGEIAFIMAVGEMLEAKATERARRGLTKLITLSNIQARIITPGREGIIPAESISSGDILRILPGEIIPADGHIISGSTSVNESTITGEALPIDKSLGDEVFGGTLNCFGAIDIQASCSGQDSSLQRLMRLVSEATEHQTPAARLADRAASWLVPAALLIAIFTAFITRDMHRAVTVLVVFCPCGLALATPTAIMAAIGQAANHGVLIKSGEALEKMHRVSLVAMDKTGTLTYGHLEVSDLLPIDDSYDEAKLLALAASAEAQSEHPLGQAIVSCALQNSLLLNEARDFRMSLGQGVSASVDGKTVLCGSEAFLTELGISLNVFTRQTAQDLRCQGKVALLTAVDSKCVGILGLADTLRPNAAQTVSHLRELGTDVALLTGDSRHTAEYFARQAGIENVQAQLLPHDKARHIAGLQNKGHEVCMIGDGINDAPALKIAHVGIAMGSIGSDLAIESADIAFMHDDITKLPYLKKLSKATLKTIAVSIGLSLLINIVAVVLSVLGWLTPAIGALVHNAGAIFAILLAAHLYDSSFTAEQTSESEEELSPEPEAAAS